MKRLISILLAAVMMLSASFAFAFIVGPQVQNSTQLSVVSVKAVDIRTTITGVRDYAALPESTRTYQTGESICLAVTLEVKNIAKSQYKYLGSIAGSDIEVQLSSPTVDLSYAKYSNPVIVSNVYNGFYDSYIASLVVPGYTTNHYTSVGLSNTMNYNTKDNTVSFTVSGVEKNSTSFLEYENIAPSVKDGKIIIAALKAKDGKEIITIGGVDKEVNFSAPDTIQYSIIVTGVTKQADSGKIATKLLVAGAERFSTKDGVGTLSIKDKYNITRQVVPASAAVDENDEDVNKEKLWVKTGSTIVAQVNPRAADAKANVNWAGGVSYSGSDLLTTKQYTNSAGKVIGENGIVVYTVTKPNGSIVCSLVSEYTYYEGDSAKSIAIFAPDTGVGYARRLYNTGSVFHYNDDNAKVENSSEIVDMLNFFGFSTGFNATYKVTDEIFESKGAAAVYSEAINGTYKTGAIVIPDVPAEEGDDEVIEVLPDPDDDPDIEDVDPPDEDLPPIVPTGDTGIALGLFSAALLLAAVLMVVKRAK